MVSYLVKQITEEDFGCEGRPEGCDATDKVVLRAISGEELSINVKDKELYDKDINEGDWVHFNHNEEIIKDTEFSA
ncbi:MAG: hypothetical protein K5773_03170 [Pseudobutyrivibrio sp.]|nr:hypothetical protein [Pseudobutyrivibrio sp.]